MWATLIKRLISNKKEITPEEITTEIETMPQALFHYKAVLKILTFCWCLVLPSVVANTIDKTNPSIGTNTPTSFKQVTPLDFNAEEIKSLKLSVNKIEHYKSIYQSFLNQWRILGAKRLKEGQANKFKQYEDMYAELSINGKFKVLDIFDIALNDTKKRTSNGSVAKVLTKMYTGIESIQAYLSGGDLNDVKDMKPAKIAQGLRKRVSWVDEILTDEYISVLAEVEKFAIDKAMQELASNKQETKELSQELASNKQETKELSQELATQKEELATQKEELATQKEELATQKEELLKDIKELEYKKALAEMLKAL